MKKYLGISFLVGLAFGAILVQLYRSTTEQPVSDDHETVQMLIHDWTYPSNDIFIASFGTGHEIPSLRYGFFPDTVRALARNVERLYRVPAAVVLAQWALESRWGFADLGASNYFGHTFVAVRKYMSTPDFVTRREKVPGEDGLQFGSPMKFARYKNIAECFDVHGRYLSGSQLYTKAFSTSSPEEFVRVLAKRYATDPDYASKLITIMRHYRLNQGN